MEIYVTCNGLSRIKFSWNWLNLLIIFPQDFFFSTKPLSVCIFHIALHKLLLIYRTLRGTSLQWNIVTYIVLVKWAVSAWLRWTGPQGYRMKWSALLNLVRGKTAFDFSWKSWRHWMHMRRVQWPEGGERGETRVPVQRIILSDSATNLPTRNDDWLGRPEARTETAVIFKARRGTCSSWRYLSLKSTYIMEYGAIIHPLLICGLVFSSAERNNIRFSIAVICTSFAPPPAPASGELAGALNHLTWSTGSEHIWKNELGWQICPQ